MAEAEEYLRRCTAIRTDMNIEGKNPVKEALDSHVKISKICISKTAHDLQPIVDIAKKKRIRIDFADKSQLDRISQSGRHQGVIAIASDFEYCEVDDILRYAKDKGEKLFMLILDGIEDPHNLGSIIRVAECAGAHGIVIPSRRSVGVNATVLRTSAVAANHMKIASVNNVNDTIRMLKDNFINVYCADMQGMQLYDTHLKEDVAIVIGSEGSGVKQLTSKLCDSAISIPQFGKVNSLNASVACGIICYEVVRQRR